MFWNKKKEEKKPIRKEENAELPELPELPEVKKFSYSDEIGNKNPNEIHGPRQNIPNLPKRRMIQELDENEAHVPSGRREVQIKEISKTRPETRVREKDSNVFVKLDKFEQALKSFEDIKSQLAEIESLLSKIKQVKTQEDQELADWEAEIKQIKSSLEDIDRTIFNKI